MEDGSRYKAGRPGGAVTVSDSHAAAIDRVSGNGDAGLVTGKFRAFGGGTKAGRWCAACRRLWYVWALVCPRCGEVTKSERERF